MVHRSERLFKSQLLRQFNTVTWRIDKLETADLEKLVKLIRGLNSGFSFSESFELSRLLRRGSDPRGRQTRPPQSDSPEG